MLLKDAKLVFFTGLEENYFGYRFDLHRSLLQLDAMKRSENRLNPKTSENYAENLDQEITIAIVKPNIGLIKY